MTIAETILSLTQKKKLHFSLLDPDKQPPRVAGHIAKTVTDAGSSAIMVGGSTLLSQQQVDETVQAIKQNSELPVILFPSGAKFLSKYADAVFFMSLLNSNNLNYVIREHVKGAMFIKHSGLEPISMGYVIVEPGMTAGRVGEADLIQRNDVQTAVGYALASQYLGMNFFYIEAGSGAPTPVPDEMIQAVKKNTSIPLLIGGGIRDAQTARQKAHAGADIIITGTAIEKDKQFKTTLSAIIEAIEGV
ncbi:MAG: geranylgeranylglyceryl/heptaprenylglyceryl phosphate synthase [Candidatus Thermoplasmatota archaeon]|nr:geranylgeranylglyceryl/heptaprenylglyceryl phosphate synthase [Candidatus Thermoplasmatota archaeon]